MSGATSGQICVVWTGRSDIQSNAFQSRRERAGSRHRPRVCCNRFARRQFRLDDADDPFGAAVSVILRQAMSNKNARPVPLAELAFLPPMLDLSQSLDGRLWTDLPRQVGQACKHVHTEAVHPVAQGSPVMPQRSGEASNGSPCMTHAIASMQRVASAFCVHPALCRRLPTDTSCSVIATVTITSEPNYSGVQITKATRTGSRPSQRSGRQVKAR